MRKDLKFLMTREEFWRQYWDRIDVSGTGYTMDLPTPNTRCWIWTGQRTAQEYGIVVIDKQRWLVHRLVHHVFSEELQEELSVLHSCNTPPCCNPLHLRQGTAVENWDDVIEDYELAQPVTDFMRGRRMC